MKKVEYYRSLTKEDKIRILFEKNRGKIRHFIVQYYGLINGRWRTIMRIDTCHRFAHKHTYYLSGHQYITEWAGDLNKVFTEAGEFITKNFPKIRENYLIANKK